jgi:uncharacterized protein DUF6920
MDLLPVPAGTERMAQDPTPDELWNSIPPAEQSFEPGTLTRLPETARRYLEHAIAPGTRLASAVRLRMHGEIKLRRWFPFTAEQVIGWERGMIWRAVVWMHGVPIRGFDRLLGGGGEMEWKVLGLIPLVNAAGPDVTRSAAGRVAAESVWLPSALCREEVSWTAVGASVARASFIVEGERADVDYGVDGEGRLTSMRLQRWGNPEGGAYHETAFGGLAEGEGTFDGYTIPTQLRIGWHFGTERFEPEGEFFRVTVDLAEYQ